MITEKIQNLVKQENKKIIFYFDADGSQFSEILEIEASGIKVVQVGHNYFELKYKLEFEWKDQPIFLYHPFAKPNTSKLKDYPLLDLLIANVELRLDDASEFLSDYRLPESQLPLVRQYIKQLKTKTNQKRLAAILDPAHFNIDNLKRGLISIALNFNSVIDRNACMAKWLCLSTDKDTFDKVNKSLKELDLDTDLLNWLVWLMDIKSDELNVDFAKDIICKLKYNILTSFVDKPVKNDSYTSLKFERAADINKLQAFFRDWTENSGLKNDIEKLFINLGSDVKSAQILNWYGHQQDYGYYTEEMLHSIINNYYRYIIADPLKTKDDLVKWFRSGILSENHLHQVTFLFHAGGVFALLDSYRSFSFNKIEDYVQEYTGELYKVDLYFRKAVSAFEKVRDRLYEYEEEAIKIFDTLNQRYDRYLIELNVEWQKLLQEHDFNYEQIPIDKQYNFYKDNLKDFEYKIVVIISDALRYELGYELYDDLLADSKNTISIESCLASIPSYTNLGMSNLLPNNGISVEKKESDLVFKINEKSTVSTNRADILRMAEKTSTTIDFSEVMKFNHEKGREYFRTHRIVYVYHDWIDAIGDKKRTEHETFDATSKAIEDIKRLMKKLYGWNVYYMLVTADHGFLFNHTELTESSREKLPVAKGYMRDHVRFVVADEFEGKVDGYKLQMRNTTNIETDLQVALPRAINRYRKQGNIGVQFAHGGASMQELLIPVVKFYKKRKDLLNTVSFKRIDNVDNITAGNIKITLLQDQPVSNEFKSNQVLFGLYSDMGDLLSNELEIDFNSTSKNPKERVYNIILTLSKKGSKASFCYLKAFGMNDKKRLNPLFGINDLLKINSLMEMDDF